MADAGFDAAVTDGDPAVGDQAQLRKAEVDDARGDPITIRNRPIRS